MKTLKTVCEMMVAASLVAVSACAAVEPADTAMAPPDDDGIATGSGPGGEPVTCSKASECGAGMTCDLSTNVCVDSLLTLDSAPFVDDGLRWWANTSEPTLTGTFRGPSESVVQVIVGTKPGVVATLTGTRWSLKLPAGTLMAVDTRITVMLTDAAGGLAKREQNFALDVTPPTLDVLSSKIRDERGDAIQFVSAGAIHDHKGEEIDLASAGCPAVYKHSYLMGSASPQYGSELSPNPLTWRFSVTDTKVASIDYRITRTGGQLVSDWKPASALGTQFAVELHRDGADGVPELGVTAGSYTIDVRARDWAGLETTVSRCWNQQPMAAPLAFAQATVPTDADALMAWSLQTNSPISRLTNIGKGAVVAEQRVTQYSAEPVVISVDVPVAPSGTTHAKLVEGYVRSSATAIRVSCGIMDCSYRPAAPTTWTQTAAVTTLTKTIEVSDSRDGTALPVTNGKVTLPGRAAGASPTEYRIRLSLSAVGGYGTDPTYQFGEYVEEQLSYTGRLRDAEQTGCGKIETTTFGTFCTSRSRYVYIRALDNITLTLNPMALEVRVAASTMAALLPPAYASAAVFVTGSLQWNGGDEFSSY